MSTFDPETIDLAALAEGLAGAFAPGPIEGYVMGRTALRDAVAVRLGCSQAEAEALVDTMIGRGFLRFDDGGPQGGPGRWEIRVR
jgi:hypothetical protein